MKATYKVFADAAELYVEVYPTMQALGDQPWQVLLYDLGDGLCLNCDSNNVVEAESAIEAASKTVKGWLESQGLPTSFTIR